MGTKIEQKYNKDNRIKKNKDSSVYISLKDYLNLYNRS